MSAVARPIHRKNRVRAISARGYGSDVLDTRHDRPGRTTAATMVRAMVAGAVLAPMTFGVLLVWGRVASNAIHLCGWPARIACDSGTPLWWLLPATVTLVALSGVALLAPWAANGRPRFLIGFAHVVWSLGLVPLTYVTRPRTFGWSDLIVGGTWVGVGLGLMAAGTVTIFPSHRGRLTRWGLGLGAVYILLLALVPSILAGVSDA